jgi:NAD-dependent dihydropyrimidine dehydrogenase PreA subunit
MSVRPYVDQELCIGCGACFNVCPAEPNCFEVDEKSTVVNPDSCIGCGQCVESCPVEAIVVK